MMVVIGIEKKRKVMMVMAFLEEKKQNMGEE